MANSTVLKKVKVQMTTKNTFINLPAKMRDMLKLDKGDELLLEYDKNSDVITVRKIGK